MNKFIKYGAIALVAVLVVAGFVYFQHPVKTGDASTGFPNGLSVGGGTYAVAPALQVTGTASTTGPGYFSQGITEGGVLATTTGSAASTTLQQSDIANISLLNITPNLISGYTLTLPASTTLTTFLPNAGDTDRIAVANATTSVAYITVSGNTGTLLQGVASTTRIFPGQAVFLNFVRKSNSDIVVSQFGN